jgi:hypothetical protein
MGMLRRSRLLALLALLVLLGGLLVWSSLEGWIALDGTEAEQTAGRLQLSLVTVLPGLVVGIIVWVIVLIGLAHQARWRGFTVLLLLPLVPIVADILVGPFLHIDPTSPTPPDGRALDMIIWSSVVFLVLLLVLCFVPGRSPDSARPPGHRS